MIHRSVRSGEPSLLDAPTVQALPRSTTAARRGPSVSLLLQLARNPAPVCTTVNNRLTSGFRTRSAGNQLAAMTFPWGCGANPVRPYRVGRTLGSIPTPWFAWAVCSSSRYGAAPKRRWSPHDLALERRQSRPRHFECVNGATTFAAAVNRLNCASRRVYSRSYRRYAARDHLRLCHRRFE
jgi:hypothetical protein